MSSPLAIFRKHQKVLLAVFGVALMLVFTVGGIVSQYTGRTATGGENPVVVQIESGADLGLASLHESDLENLRFGRLYLQQFMRSLNYLAADRTKTAPKQWLGVPNQDDERSLLQTLLLSRKATDMGIVVTDESIKGYLQAYSDGQVEVEEFGTILAEISQRRMSQPQFFDAMRQELLAMRFMELFQRGITPLPPATSWEYFQRLNRQVSLEAVPFPVANYVSQVEQPTEQEIAALYEEGKDRFDFPSQPEPGFKRRKKIALEYVKADLQTFLDEETPKISEQDVRKYYETNREEFRTFDGSSTGGSDTETPPLSSEEPALPLDDDLDLDLNLTSPDTEGATPDAGLDSENSDLDLAPVNPEATQPLQDDPTDDGPKINEAPPEITETSDDNAEPEATEPEATEPEATEPEATEPEATEPEATEPEATEPGAAEAVEEVDAVEQVIDGADAAESAAAIEADDGTEIDLDAELGLTDEEPVTAEESAAGTDLTDEESGLGTLPEAAGDNVSTPAPRYRSLEEVQDEIRTRLASPMARERMDRELNSVRSTMSAYYRKYLAWEYSVTQDKNAPKPPAPDLAKLAAERGLTHGTIPLVDVLGLEEADPVTGEPRYEISRAYSTDFQPFAQIVFGNDNLAVYKDASIRGAILDTEYVFWKTNQVDEQVPSLEECRSEVERALKVRKAFQLATDKATVEAERARSSSMSLGAMFGNDPDRTVIETNPFSWMTPANVPYLPPSVSRVPGIEYAGPEFMKSVFEQEVGGVGVAPDNPHKTVYLFAVKSELPEPEKLQDAYMRSGLTSGVAQLAQLENRELMSKWYQDFEKQLGVEWVRDPRPDSRQR